MSKKILLLTTVFFLFFLSFSLAEEEKNKKKGKRRKPKRPAPIHKEEEGTRDRTKIRQILKKVDEKLYSLQAEGVRNFTCAVPLSKVRPDFGDKATATLVWKAPNRAAVKLSQISPKADIPAKMLLKNYLKDVTLFMAGVPYSKSLAGYDLRIKDDGFTYTIIGKEVNEKNHLVRQKEIRIDRNYTVLSELIHVTRAGRTNAILRQYEYEEKDGKFIPHKVESTDHEKKVTIIYIDYEKVDQYWVRSQSLVVRLAKKAEKWDYTDYRFNQDLDESLFRK